MKAVADQLAEILPAVGVNRIYGRVGERHGGYSDAIRRLGKEHVVERENRYDGSMAGVIGFSPGFSARRAGEIAKHRQSSKGVRHVLWNA